MKFVVIDFRIYSSYSILFPTMLSILSFYYLQQNTDIFPSNIRAIYERPVRKSLSHCFLTKGIIAAFSRNGFSNVKSNGNTTRMFFKKSLFIFYHIYHVDVIYTTQ